MIARSLSIFIAMLPFLAAAGPGDVSRVLKSIDFEERRLGNRISIGDLVRRPFDIAGCGARGNLPKTARGIKYNAIVVSPRIFSDGAFWESF